LTTVKHKVANILRRFHLLQLADTVLFAREIFRNRKLNQAFLKSHHNFNPPPNLLAYDAYNHTNWQSYFDTGLSHARLVSDITRAYIQEKKIKICEWGCGPARVIRHLETIKGFNKVELFGTDFNKKSIKWCKKNIRSAHFSLNNLGPPLSYEPEIFDCVYAISVFTHLSEKMHYAWVEELFRTIKPGGILIFTTHGDQCAKRLTSIDKDKYDSGMIVIKDRIYEGKKLFAAYHPPKFIKERLLQNYLVVKHYCNPAEYHLEQDVWVVKRHIDSEV